MHQRSSPETLPALIAALPPRGRLHVSYLVLPADVVSLRDSLSCPWMQTRTPQTLNPKPLRGFRALGWP